MLSALGFCQAEPHPVQLANSLPPTQGQAILDAARHAFIWSHSVALSSAGSMLLLLAVGISH
ncbi:methyl viologen resistance protein SmvA [Salmonella enterica subsp. enterica]